MSENGRSSPSRSRSPLRSQRSRGTSFQSFRSPERGASSVAPRTPPRQLGEPRTPQRRGDTACATPERAGNFGIGPHAWAPPLPPTMGFCTPERRTLPHGFGSPHAVFSPQGLFSPQRPLFPSCASPYGVQSPAPHLSPLTGALAQGFPASPFRSPGARACAFAAPPSAPFSPPPSPPPFGVVVAPRFAPPHIPAAPQGQLWVPAMIDRPVPLPLPVAPRFATAGVRAYSPWASPGSGQRARSPLPHAPW